MHIKRFEAATMEAALEQVRATLGPDALILSTRTIQRGRGTFGLLARSGVEVQAAVPRGGAATTPASDVARSAVAVERAGRAAAIGGEGGEALHGALESLRRDVSALRSREAFEEELQRELRGLRSMIARMLERTAVPAAERGAVRLAESGLESAHVRALGEAVEAARAEGRAATLESVLQERIEARLAPPRCDRTPRVRVLVGAPGAGKTTTLAKLAARNEEGERDVSLVSLDPFRIGAREQLRAFAGLLEVPYEEIASPEALADVARRHRDHAILVDTAGRSPGDVARQLPLAGLREHFGDGASIELVVDASARAEVARAQVARFASLRPDRLILTKLDECESLVPVVNLLLEPAGPPVCWLGTGQRVPEDLEIAEPAPFVRSVVGRAA
ncbi:MAG: flagellar biosynthesis protein FlhF [Myxococcota bacterium]